MRQPVRSFSEEEEAPEQAGASENAEAEYAFEGFEVVFSDKVALLPAGAEKN
jgi:hypothetical protein